MQKEIIETAAKFNAESNGHIADIVGCSEQHVQSVKSKVSLFVEPASVSFEIPEIPVKTGLTEPLLTHEQCRFEADTWGELKGDSEEADNNTDGKPVNIEEIGKRRYEHEEDAESIAADFGISVNAVGGYLSQYKARETENAEGSSINNEYQKFDALDGVFPDHYIEVFNRLAAGQNRLHIAEQIGMSKTVVYTVRQKSVCYIDPEELPFDAPDEINKEYLNQQDKQALADRRESETDDDANEDRAGEPDNWPTNTEPRTAQPSEEVSTESKQAELPADGGQIVRRQGKERMQTRVDEDILKGVRALEEQHGITESEAVRRLVRKGLTAESVEDFVNEDLKTRMHSLEKAIKQNQSEIDELVSRVEVKLTARERREQRERKKAEAGLLTRAWWAVFGMDLDDQTDE
jgi:antitoxin component of RelBE/YafQ-DinJ toxin-antitoxin module